MKIIPNTKRMVNVPPRLGIKLSYLAEQLDCSVATLRRNIDLPPDHPRHLPAFKVSETEWRVNWEDLTDWIMRNRNDVVIEYNDK